MRGRQLADYVVGARVRGRVLPPVILNAAKRALVDFLGVTVGAVDEAPVRSVRGAVDAWHAAGNAQIFLGPRTTPALAVLVNATMAHAMDFDDTHPMGGGHPSGPCWSTALAMAQEVDAGETDIIAAFLTGYEVMTKLGGGGVPGVGRSLQRRGFHPTSMFGRMGAAAVASVLLGLDEGQVQAALGAAATTAGGLVGSFGTHSKPFHSGKAAMDGILAAQLAANGFIAATHLYERDKGLLDAFIQDRVVEVPPLDFDEKWEILDNAFKPFASCRGTHPSTQAARSLASRVAGRPIAEVRAQVHPGCLVTAGKPHPRTPLEGKFSVAFCISLGLAGYEVVAPDFCDAAYNDPRVRDILSKVHVTAIDGQAPYCAHLDVVMVDGESLHADTDIVLGHPDNPMSWDDLRTKFEGLAKPVLGAGKSADLFEVARNFEQRGSLRKLMALLQPIERK
jgi:2-methylcitrate dehydratase PrpD